VVASLQVLDYFCEVLLTLLLPSPYDIVLPKLQAATETSRDKLVAGDISRFQDPSVRGVIAGVFTPEEAVATVVPLFHKRKWSVGRMIGVRAAGW